MRIRPAARLAGVLVTVLFGIAACADDHRGPPAGTRSAPQEAEARIGDAIMHVSVVQTATLDARIAGQYGLERSDRLAMLLVSVRRTDGSPGPADVEVTATAVPSQGAPQPIALRRIRVDDLVDHVGTVEIAPPETIRFDVVVRYGTAASTMSFSRDFYPR